MRKPSDVWVHWSEHITEDGSKKVKCRYCEAKPMTKNATKCADHTGKCQARIDQGIDFELTPPNSDKSSTTAAVATKTSVRTKRKKANWSEDEWQASGSDNVADKTKRKAAIAMISDLLRVGDDSPSARKKPFSKYTDEDFKKEERELRIKELRLNVQLLEMKHDLYERLLPLADKASQALDSYLDERAAKEQNVHDPFGTPGTSQVQVVYTSQAEDTATTAYETRTDQALFAPSVSGTVVQTDAQ